MTAILLPTRLVAQWIDIALVTQHKRLGEMEVESWTGFAATVQCRQQLLQTISDYLLECGATVDMERMHVFVDTKMDNFVAYFDIPSDLFCEVLQLLHFAAELFPNTIPIRKKLRNRLKRDLAQLGLGPFSPTYPRNYPASLLAACDKLEKSAKRKIKKSAKRKKQGIRLGEPPVTASADQYQAPTLFGDFTEVSTDHESGTNVVAITVLANRLARSLAVQYSWIRRATRYPQEEVSCVRSVVSTIERIARSVMLNAGFVVDIVHFEKILLAAQESDSQLLDSDIGLISSTYGQVIREVCRQPNDEPHDESPEDYSATQPPPVNAVDYFDDDPHYFRHPENTAIILLCFWFAIRAERKSLTQAQYHPIVSANMTEAIEEIEAVMDKICSVAKEWVDVHTVSSALEKKRRLFVDRPGFDQQVGKLFERVTEQIRNRYTPPDEQDVVGETSPGPTHAISIHSRLAKAIKAERLGLSEYDSGDKWDYRCAIDQMEVIVVRFIVSANDIVDLDSIRDVLLEEREKLTQDDTDGEIERAFANVIRLVCPGK